MLVPLAGASALLLGQIWLTGAIAGMIFGSGWTTLRAGELVATAVRLPSHLDDPRLAWPPRMREALPGVIGLYAALALALGATGGLALLAHRLHGAIGRDGLLPGRTHRPASAHWASGRDLRALRVDGPRKGRLILGRHGRRLIAAEERQSVIVLAPAQSGKTTGLAIPSLLEWRGPALVTSVKSDLLNATLAGRHKMGRAMVFDPVDATRRGNVRATPLHACGSWHGALRVANWLSTAARPGGQGLSDADFWYQAAEKLLAPLLFAAAANGETIDAVVTWLDQGPKAKEEVNEILSPDKPNEEFEAAKLAWEANWNRESRQRSSIYTTAETITAAFADPRVKEACSAAEYTPTDLLDRGASTLYLCAPAHEQQRLRPLFSMMVRELISVVYESSAATGEPIDPPLLLVLDELANIAPIPNLDEVASTGAGQGIQLLSIFQDMAQIKSRYGEIAAQTITNNHRAKVFGTGISDPDTLSYISQVVGTGEFEHRSETADDKGGAARTQASIYRELTPANVIREATRGTGLLVYGHLPPAKIRLRRPPKPRTLDSRDLPSALPEIGEART
ncbi:MAG: type IV secretory system conjugative DNA transfer family protein [Gemmatimonadales bacterium]